MGKKKKKKKEKELYSPPQPIVVCKYFRMDGSCSELADRLCSSKRPNHNWLYPDGDKRVAICDRYVVEGMQNGNG